MATFDLYINLRPEIGQPAFVKSATSGAAFQFPKVFREGKMPFRIFPLVPNPSGGFAAPFSAVDGASYQARAAIGSPGSGGTAAEILCNQAGFLWNATDGCFDTDGAQGNVLNINTLEMNAVLDAATSPEVTRTFEVQIKSGAEEEFTAQTSVTIRNEVIVESGGLPVDVTDSLFADMLEAAIPPTTENDFPRTGNTFALRPAIYRDFILSGSLRVANPRASGSYPSDCVATNASVVATATVAGLDVRRAIVKLRVRGFVSDNSCTGGSTFISDTYLPSDLAVNVGGTLGSGGVFATLAVSSPAQTFNLNAASGGGGGGVGRAFDYSLDVVVDEGATLTLTHLVDNGGKIYASNGRGLSADMSLIPGVDPYPSAYDGEFLEIIQSPVVGIESAASWQEASVSTAGNTDILFERYSLRHGAKVTAAVGAGAYTRTLALKTANRTRGDVAVIRLVMPTSVNPTIEVRNDSSGGTLLTTIAGAATGEDYRVECAFDGTAWVLVSVAPDITAPTATALVLYDENPNAPTAPSATGENAVAIGDGAEASATWSGVFGGKDNTASAQDAAVVGGRDGVASGAHATVVGGASNVASARSASARGEDALSDIECGAAIGSGGLGAGLAQIRDIPLTLSTSNATPTQMSSPGGGFILVRANTAWAFSVHVIARRAGGAGHAAWKIEGAIYRDGTVGSAAIIGDVEVSPNSANVAGWNCNVTADTTNGALKITCTGGAYQVRWNARVELSEITFA